MASSSILLLPVLLILLRGGATGAMTIPAVCSHAVQFGPLNYYLCISSLTGDPGSSTAINPADFAGVATHQALVRVQAACDAASHPNQDPAVASLLGQCATLYKGALANVQTAMGLLQNQPGKPAMTSAIHELAGAWDRSRQCASAFGRAGKPSPMAQQSSDATDMLQISGAIIELALQSPPPPPSL